MKISLNQLAAYNKCPILFKEGVYSKPLNEYFVPNIDDMAYLYAINDAYLHRFANGIDIEWGDIRRIVFNHLTKYNSIELAAEKAKHIITNLVRWSKNSYHRNSYYGVKKIKASVKINEIVISDELPLLLFKENPHSLLIINTTGQKLEAKNLYNNFLIRANLWLASKYFQSNINLLEIVNFHETYVSVTNLKTPKNISNFDDIIHKMTLGLKYDIIYPSRTNGCESCPLTRSCSL